MLANRMQYIVFFQGKQIVDKLQTLPLDVTYISTKQGYAVVYGDKEQEQNYKKQLKMLRDLNFLDLHIFLMKT
jgi:uncharacterized protein YlbG (UPF0298 family)